MTRWLTMTCFIGPSDQEASIKINDLGKEGWRLVQVCPPITQGPNTGKCYAYLTKKYKERRDAK